MTLDEAITKIFKKYDVPTSNPFFFEILKVLEQDPGNNAISRETVKTEYKRRLESSLKDESIGLDLTHLADCTRFNEFIDSIPPVTPQPCDDAISRQAVNTLIDELARAISDERCGILRGRSTATIMRDICHLSSVTPQPKTGYWIPLGNYDEQGNESSYKCSECGDIDAYYDNYCPNCGAKMVEPQESEEV